MRKLDWDRIWLWLRIIYVLGYLCICIAAYAFVLRNVFLQAFKSGWGASLWVAVVFILGPIGFLIWLGRCAHAMMDGAPMR